MVRGSTSGVRIRGKKIQIDFYYKDKRCREMLSIEPTPKNLKYAAQLRAAILFEIEQNKFDYKKYFPNSKQIKLFDHTQLIKMENLFNELLNIYNLRHKNGNMTLSSLQSYSRIITGHLMPVFNNLNINDLRPKHIKDWLYTLSLTKKTIHNILIPFNRVLKNAVNDKLIKVNPLDELDIEDIINNISTKNIEMIDPFNEHERNHLLSKAQGQFKNLIQFGMWSGLRIGELIALRWSDIDFINGLIHVKHSIVCGKEKPPKTKSGIRSIIMLPKAKEALIAQKEYTFNFKDFVFHNPNTNKVWSRDSKIRLHWKLLFNDNIVHYRYPYQMRHTYASILLSGGENIAWIATQLGHVNTEMVIKNYGKFIPDKNILGGYQIKGNY